MSDEAFSSCRPRTAGSRRDAGFGRGSCRAAHAVQGAPAYVPQYNWTGFYLGINGGGAWGNSDWNGFAVSNSPSGGMIGVTAGYNWQGMGSPWVFGLEGDIDWTNIKDNATACGALNCQTKNNWLGTVRGRVGYAFDRFMPYFTGGLAFGDVQANLAGFPGIEDTNAGWTVGVGIEGVIAGNWTAKVEYLYVDLGDTTCSRRRLRHGDQRRPEPQHPARRPELPLLIKQRTNKLEAPDHPVRGFFFCRVSRRCGMFQTNNPTAR